jgi:hypothetical protein
LTVRIFRHGVFMSPKFLMQFWMLLRIGDAIEKITVTMMGQFSETVHSFDGVIELIKKLLPPQ